MLQDGRREKNMNKKSVKFILPRQQIQEKRNIFDGSRTAALLESEQNSEKAHAKGVLHKGSGVQCYKTHYMGQELSFKRDREKNHPARLSRRAAVCKVLQRLLLVQKVPPIQ